MEVAIISSKECFFSNAISDKVRLLFERMVTSEGQRINVTLQELDLRDLDHSAKAAEFQRVKVQIVIISNHFLERLQHEETCKKKISIINYLPPANNPLCSERVIAILAGTTAAEIFDANLTALAQFNEWFSLELRPASKIDADFCEKFTNQVIQIYNLEPGNSDPNFSVFPEKINHGQAKVVVILKKPLGKNDAIRIEFSTQLDASVLNRLVPTNPYTIITSVPDSHTLSNLQLTLFVNNQKLGTQSVRYVPKSNATEDNIARMSKTLPGFQKFLDDHISHALSKNFRSNTDWTSDPDLELLNSTLASRGGRFPTLMHFAAHYGLEQTVWTLLDESDGSEQCNVYNDMNETPLDIAQGNIKQTIKDHQDMTMSCKAFQYVKDLVFRNSEHGDEILSAAPDSGKRGSESTDEAEEAVQQQQEEEDEEKGVVSKPTNAEESEASGSNMYANILPPSRASKARRSAVSASLQPPVVPARRNAARESKDRLINYANVPAEVPTDKDQWKRAPSLPSKPGTPRVTDGYDVPRWDTYDIPPPGLHPVDQSKTASAIITPQPGQTVRPDSSGYLPMNPPENPPLQENLEEIINKIINPADTRQAYPPSSPSPLGPVPPAPIRLDPPDEDLVEIMNDFKNNVYSMRQLELLFEHWKRRSDVKMSYQERQARLKGMRNEYNQIQEKLKGEQRRPSMMNKVFSFFNSGRKKGSTSSVTVSLVPEESPPEPQGPPRKLSPNQNQRKVSNHTDRGSLGSGHSGGVSDSESIVSLRDKSAPAAWVNPMARNCVVSYVDPQDLRSFSPLPTPTPERAPQSPPIYPGPRDNPFPTGHYQEPPPPRVYKPKITPPSILTEEPTPSGTPPPRLPKPVPKKPGNGTPSDDLGLPPPVPPPRGERASPFRLIKYEKKAQDGSAIVEKRNDGSWFATDVSASSSATQPYENTTMDGLPLPFKDSKK